VTPKRTKAIRLGRPPSSRSKMSHARIVNRVLLQPWFLPQRIAFAIHSMVPPEFWNKMRYYFDDYGCMVCKAETGYHSNGMCKRCSEVVRKKLAASLGRRTERRVEPRLDLALFRQEKAAKKLLKQFSVRGPGSSQKRSIEIPARNNPVYEALVARLE
jgi:hypothetical protein